MKNKRIFLISFLSVFIVIMIASVVAVVLIYNNIINKKEGYEQKVLEKLVQLEEHNKELERVKIEVIKFREEKNVKEMIGFYEKFNALREEYLKNINVYEIDIKEKVISIGELKENVNTRMVAARDFKEQLENIDNIPGQLQNFYNLNIDYLNNEIQIMYYIIAYYGGFNYSTYDDTELKELIVENYRLLMKIDEELKRVFIEYDIEYLL